MLRRLSISFHFLILSFFLLAGAPAYALTAQTITFGAQTARTFGTSPAVLNPVATASSGLAISYTSSTTSICTIAGSTVTLVAAGTCTIVASQVGNATFSAATPVAQDITVNLGSQSITFGTQTGKTFGAAPFQLSPLATASSRLTVSYSSTTPAVCTISGSTVTIVSAGTCTIAADQAGNGNYTAATQVTQNIAIAKASQKITFGTQTGRSFGADPFALNPLATASSSLEVVYTSTTPAVCTIAESTVTIVAVGTCTIAANQPGDASYSAAPQLTQNIVIGKAAQTITFAAQSAQIIGVAPFAVNPVATASSGLDVSYSSTTATICSISGTTVTALAVGTCTISASQAGNASYAAATAVTQSIKIGNPTAPGAPTLTGITAGFGTATVSFSAPTNNGGSAITAYTATCTASGQTTRSASAGTGTTIIVQGLTVNVSYACTVSASNSVGTGSASAALPVIPTATYAIPTTGSALTGLWSNANESGWGMSITQHAAMIFVGWFSYDTAGAATWYVMPSCPILGNACTGDIYAVSGGQAFVAAWDGSTKVVTKVGTGILVFSNANTGAFNFLINEVAGQKSITRHVFATGATPANPDYSDLWWNENESGWGVSITQQYGTIFATLFGYDSAGNPSWYIASDCRVFASGCGGDLYRVSGGSAATAAWNGSGLLVTKIGFVDFAFGSNTSGTMNFFIDGVAGSKAISRGDF